MTVRTDPRLDTDIHVIQELVKLESKKPKLRGLLEASLQKANDLAMQKLNPNLYKALKWWPTDFKGYLEYLAWFCRWIPHQEKHLGWKDPHSEGYREPLDRLCHFYWLIDQPVGRGKKKIVEDLPEFAAWLVDYARAWGDFLDTTESFNDEVLQSFIKLAPKYRVEDSMFGDPPRPNAPSGWLTFNQFFARELNPGLRMIAEPMDNTFVTCPADCTYRADYPINADSSIEEITVKGTHKYANVKDLLAGSRYAEAFAGGHFVHYFLSPYSYHRFHTPVAGRVEECFKTDGRVFLNVVMKDGQFDAPDLAQDGYEFNQARGVITINTSGCPFGDLGMMAVVPIGMAQVSGVNMTHSTGMSAMKGDEFGYFTFGGSDIIVLFQEGAHPRISKGPYYRHYGMAIARCTLFGG